MPLLLVVTLTNGYSKKNNNKANSTLLGARSGSKNKNSKISKIILIFFLLLQRLAIFQLLTDTEDHLPQLGLVAFGLGCANAPLSLLLVCAALFRLPCGLGIWLTGSIIQLVVIGLPLFVYSFLLILYVAVQMNLYVEAACAASIVGLLYLLALIMWLTVLGCYHQMKDMERGMSYRRHGDYEAEGYTRRGQNGSSGHQRRSNGYQLRHFYPTHTGSSSSSRQLPPLPHH